MPSLHVTGRLLESEPIKNDLWWIGVLLDAFATLAGTGGKQLLRYAVISKNPWYYPLGLMCTAMIDPAFDISAYGFAAQSIIAPCAGMVVVWNVLLAPCTLNERLTRSRLSGALLILVGTICVGLYGSHDDVERSVDEYLQLFSRPAAMVYYLIFAVWTCVCLYTWRRGSAFASGFAMGALGGSLAGNMFTTKAVVEMFKCVAQGSDNAQGCDANPFFTPYPYLFFTISMARLTLTLTQTQTLTLTKLTLSLSLRLSRRPTLIKVLATVSLYMLAVGLRSFEALYMITVFEGFMIISGAVSGNVVMNEAAHQQTYELVLYAMSIGIILCGLYVLCRGEQPRGDDAQQRMLARCRVGVGEGSEMTSSTSEIKQARDDEHERDKAPL